MFPVLLALALLFDFLNGIHDSSNIVATVIFSHALRPRIALLLAAISHFAGPFLFGVAVATTIGKGLLDHTAIQANVIIAALIGAILWNLITWYLGIPSSSSHALIGGLLGASVLSSGLHVVQLSGLIRILVALFISPILGFAVGFFFIRFTFWAFRNASPRINHFFRRMQIFTLIGLGLSHGTNAAQKTMGVITLGLVLVGDLQNFHVPLWVVAASAAAIALGTSFGSWQLIRTLGGKMFRIRPVHGFTSQIAGASVILVAALLGGPVSTTQVMSSAIIGTGAGERISKVRWNILGDFITAWLLTIPASAGLSALSWFLLDRFVVF